MAPTDLAPARTPGVLIHRLSGPLNVLLGCGLARWIRPDLIQLSVDDDEAAEGGMVTIAMRVPVKRDGVVHEELFSAWLAVPPGVEDGAELTPSVLLHGMEPLRFRIRRV